MRLTWRRRPRALTSFLGLMDIKTGVTIALLFALLNKVAGIYGLIAVFTGGSLAQLSMYLYSVGGLVVLAWGLRAVSEEDPKRTLYFAHLFFADHLLSTIWTAFFAVLWWLYTPHDGRRIANSKAQQDLIRWSEGIATPPDMNELERADAALHIWNKEKGFAAGVLLCGWCIKVYFALLIYSYALHLRTGSYRSLPFVTAPRRHAHALDELDDGLAEDPAEDLRAAPLRTPNGSTFGRKKPAPEDDAGAVDEVLFDEDERASTGTGTGTGGFHSRLGTDETTSSSETDEAAARAPRR